MLGAMDTKTGEYRTAYGEVREFSSKAAAEQAIEERGERISDAEAQRLENGNWAVMLIGTDLNGNDHVRYMRNWRKY